MSLSNSLEFSSRFDSFQKYTNSQACPKYRNKFMTKHFLTFKQFDLRAFRCVHSLSVHISVSIEVQHNKTNSVDKWINDGGWIPCTSHFFTSHRRLVFWTTLKIAMIGLFSVTRLFLYIFPTAWNLSHNCHNNMFD